MGKCASAPGAIRPNHPSTSCVVNPNVKESDCVTSAVGYLIHAMKLRGTTWREQVSEQMNMWMALEKVISRLLWGNTGTDVMMIKHGARRAEAHSRTSISIYGCLVALQLEDWSYI